MFTLSLPRTLAGALLLSGAATAQAATLQVNIKEDAYDGICNHRCSLRDAVTVANQTPEADLILLLHGVIRLSRPPASDVNGVPIEDNDNRIGDLDIVGELRIRGLGPTGSVIHGGIRDRLFQVHPGSKVILEQASLSGGASNHAGGAIKNEGDLTLRRMSFTFNHATSSNNFQSGGAVANYGTLGIFDSHFADNAAYGLVGRGGAIYNTGELLVRQSSFVLNNALRGFGGAIYNGGSARIERSSFDRDYVQRNSDYGGAIFNESKLKMTNSTLSGNQGGGVINEFQGQLFLTNVTIADTIGTGLVNWGEILIRNSMIVRSVSSLGSFYEDCWNYNSPASIRVYSLLLSTPGMGCPVDMIVPKEQVDNQLLLPLVNEGDYVFYPLRPESPAIDAGTGDCPSQDQRGVTRPQDGNGDGVAVCDLGAIEFTTQ